MDRLTVTLLGHKDHGKSTLIGRLLHDTGSVRADRVAEVRAACRAADRPFDLSFLVDSFQEERRDGMTMDVIHAQITGKRHEYDCVDVPGHKELIQNMLTGASRADAGLLIVSALEGVEEQTGQHLRLAAWLGIPRLIVAVNKMDAVGYAESAFRRTIDRLDALVSLGNLGELAVPIAALTGDNVASAPAATMPWYRGPSLLDRLESLERNLPAELSPLRIPIQDAYDAPPGRLLVGRIESGGVALGQDVVFAPSGARGRIVELTVSGKPAKHAGPGENVGIRLEVDRFEAVRGEVACAADAVASGTRNIAARAIFLDAVPREATAECGANSTPCRIEGGADVEPGEVAHVVLRCQNPLVVEPGPTALGRIALKLRGRVIGVATVSSGAA